MSRAGHFFIGIKRSVRNRPIRATILLITILAVAAASGGYLWAVVTYRRAVNALESNRPEDAVSRFETCLRIWPDDPRVLLLSAKASRRAGDFEKAEAKLNRYFTFRNAPRDEAQVEYWLIRIRLGDDEAADPLFRLIEQNHPDSPEILDAISLNYMSRLRYQAANACLSRWIELQPDNALPYDRRGWIYERTSSPALAYKDYVRALELDPERTLVRLRLVEMLLEEKKITEASPHLEKLASQSSHRVEIEARLGMLRFLEGKSDESRRILEAVEPRLDKHDATPLVYLARLDVQEGRGAEAESRLRKVIDLDPSESDARFVLIAALRLQGRESEAVAAEQEQLRIRERNERVNQLLRDRADKINATADEWFEIGSIFAELHMDSRALYWFDKTLARDPGHAPTHRAMADYYERKGERSRAEYHRKQIR